MDIDDDQPVHVTGTERRHPAIRKLARACIELARVRLQEAAVLPAEESADSPTDTEEWTPEPEASND